MRINSIPNYKEKIRTIANTCRNYRLESGLTQAAIAADLGVTPGAIAAFEDGRSNSAIFAAYYLAKFRPGEWALICKNEEEDFSFVLGVK